MNSALAEKSETARRRLRLHEFRTIRQMMYDSFGIDLDGKEVLVAARLGKKLRELSLASYEQYIEHIQQDASGESLTGMVDALTTNHTSFFRELQHFDYLRHTVLPTLHPSDSIRIWSAACSTGEEPYSIAFTLIEELEAVSAMRATIVATDISSKVLAHAERGIYPESRFGDIPIESLRRFVLKGSGESMGHYLIRKEIRSLITFNRLNLMEDFSHIGLFSVIFCRNVMIYFDRETQQNLVNRLADQLEPGGHLLIGHSESLNGIEHPLRYVCPATYRKSSAGSNSPHGRRAS
jgi:chemotaxis protein methyltransferase CheR